MPHLSFSKAILGAIAAAFVAATLVLPSTAHAEVKIVATLGDLGAIAREVVGPHGRVDVLAAPQQDPHFVDAKPSYVARLSRADLVIYNGMSLEIGWLPSLITGSRNPDLRKGEPGHFDASTAVVRRGQRQTAVDRSMGDVHPEGDPHYSFDPRQAARVALALGKRLGQIDPPRADAYARRATAFAKDAIRVAQKWELRFGQLPSSKRRVVVFHEAWAYVEHWLKLEAVAAVEPKPGVPPNPKHIAHVLADIKRTGARAILQMEYYPDAATKLLSSKTSARLILVQGQTRIGHSYLERVDQLAQEIYDAITLES